MESACRARVLLRPTPAELPPLAVKVVQSSRHLEDVYVGLNEVTKWMGIYFYGW